jgi:hypothetical protein
LPTPQVRWPGKSGNKYVYRVYPVGTKLKAIPGNFIFAKKMNDVWSPLYISQTEDLSARFLDDRLEECVQRNGATHVHVHKASDEVGPRVDEEIDLRGNFGSPCNDRLSASVEPAAMNAEPSAAV